MCRHVEKWSRSLAPNRDTPLSYITIILYIRGRYADRCKIAMEYFAAHDEWNRRKNQKKNNKYWNIESDNNRAHSAVIFCILFLFFFGTKYNPDLSAHRNERRKWKSSSLIRPKSTHVIWFHIFFSFLSCGCCYCVLLFRLGGRFGDHRWSAHDRCACAISPSNGKWSLCSITCSRLCQCDSWRRRSNLRKLFWAGPLLSETTIVTGLMCLFSIRAPHIAVRNCTNNEYRFFFYIWSMCWCSILWCAWQCV